MPATYRLGFDVGGTFTDLSQTLIRRASEDAPGLAAALRTIYADLETRATRGLRDSALDAAAMHVTRSVDARYLGQNFELTVPVAEGAIGPEVLQRVRVEYDTAHTRLDGPAIIEQMDATTVIPPDAVAKTDALGNLCIDVR